MILPTDRILVLDGAMGTMLQRKGLEGSGEAFNITAPEVVLSIHKEYIEAGADIIETNTFNASYEEALAGARIAREAADAAGRKIYVAGSLGPKGKSLSMGTDADDPSKREISFDEMSAEYGESIKGLIEGGVDFILLETCFDALNTKAALYALSRIKADMPVIVSVSCADRSGRVLTGQTLEAYYRSVSHCNLISFGLNCSLGAEQMLPLVREVSKFARCGVSCYPNAGLPNETGGYDETPEAMAAHISQMAREGLVNIVGGCCGTNPEHIKAIAEAVKDIKPRRMPADNDDSLFASGLESYEINLQKNNFTNVGERTNVAGSKKFLRLISSGDYAEACSVAAAQIEAGANVIDINMDDAMLDSGSQMRTFIRHIQSDPAIAKAALMIDSSHFETILEGLKNSQGKCIVNSLSLKEGEVEFLKKAREVKALGAALVIMAFDEKGQATDYQRKIEICARAYNLLIGIGFCPSDIIFDVNVLSVGTGLDSDRKYAVDFIEAVRWIKENLPGAKTSGGISNLSFAFRGNNKVREAMHSVFLYHAIGAGLDMAIVNPGMLQIYEDIDPDLRKAVEDVILDRDSEASARLTQLASSISAEVGKTSSEKTAVDIPLEDMLVKGVQDGLEEKVLAALKALGDAKSVVEGPLMAGMEKVGVMFSEGKMFLPQVVKSARIMKAAVEILNPYMSSSTVKSKGTFVIATVKGDVHDIGKNITATVLRCNGFEVIDLGVMVDNEEILRAAKEHNADIIGVSGLITPSLKEMENLCEEMSARGMKTPLFVGGATASALHTAVKLSPLYGHVYYGSDASATSVMASRYMAGAFAFESAERVSQQRLRELYAKRKSSAQAVEICSDEDYAPEDSLKEIPVSEVPLCELEKFISWDSFLAIWGIRQADRRHPANLEFLAKAQDELKVMNIKVMAGMHVVKAAEFGHKEMPLWAFLKDDSPLGIFAASVISSHPKGCGCEICSLTEDSLLQKTLKLVLADAASAYLESRIPAKEGFKTIMPAVGYPSCPDHSLKKEILEMLPESEKLEISLTESFSMIPDASVSGFALMNKKAKYL